jgi:acetyl esterase/lipase
MMVLAMVGLLLCPVSQQADTSPGVQKLAREIAEAQRGGDNTRAWEQNIALALLALKKARLLETEGAFLGGQKVMGDALAQGEKALKRLRSGEAFAAKAGQLSELAYIAENDGSAQPYYLYLPPKYDPAKKWPMIVFLHGYVPTISVLDPWVPWKTVMDVAGRNGCMLLVPYGRRNTDFQGVGEVDVLETIRLACRDYPVDEARIYMFGVSMGGMGAWNMALRHPGMFAATTPVCGHTDMLKWRHWETEDVAPFKKWLIEWDNPVDLVMNARGQRFFVQHGSVDHLVPVGQSRTMVAAAKAIGINIEYREYPREDHYVYLGTEPYERAWGWLTKYTLDRAPREIDYKTYSPEFDRAFWVRVDRPAAWGKPAVVHARADEGRRSVEVTAENVGEISINAREAKLAENAEIRVNGGAVKPSRAEGEWLTWVLSPLPASEGFPPAKRKGMCGPLEEVFDTPFILVQGTGGGPGDVQKVAEAVGTWAREWDGFADGYPRVATDTELTEEQIGRYDLVLFGTPKTNSVLARIADKLPVKIGENEFTVGERTFSGEDLGLVMCYPNPLAPGHYVAIYSGARYGEKLTINHKHDLAPDFLMFRGGSFDYDNVNEWVCGGFFDAGWRLSAETTWVRAARK